MPSLRHEERVEGAVRARVPGVSTEVTAAVTVAGSPTGLVVRCTRIDPATVVRARARWAWKATGAAR